MLDDALNGLPEDSRDLFWYDDGNAARGKSVNLIEDPHISTFGIYFWVILLAFRISEPTLDIQSSFFVI